MAEDCIIHAAINHPKTNEAGEVVSPAFGLALATVHRFDNAGFVVRVLLDKPNGMSASNLILRCGFPNEVIGVALETLLSLGAINRTTSIQENGRAEANFRLTPRGRRIGDALFADDSRRPQ